MRVLQMIDVERNISRICPGLRQWQCTDFEEHARKFAVAIATDILCAKNRVSFEKNTNNNKRSCTRDSNRKTQQKNTQKNIFFELLQWPNPLKDVKYNVINKIKESKIIGRIVCAITSRRFFVRRHGMITSWNGIRRSTVGWRCCMCRQITYGGPI